eukprot:7379009-Prymnesium_polylepis.2
MSSAGGECPVLEIGNESCTHARLWAESRTGGPLHIRCELSVSPLLFEAGGRVCACKYYLRS